MIGRKDGVRDFLIEYLIRVFLYCFIFMMLAWIDLMMAMYTDRYDRATNCRQMDIPNDSHWIILCN